MASFFSKGTVIEGAYKGNYVFGLYENQLHLFDTSSVNSWKYNSGQVKPTAVVDRSTVKSVELLQEREKGVNAADVGGAALLLGPIMGAAMYADGKKKLFYVNVQFNNGLQSLLKIESDLYDIVQRITFELPKKSFIIENESKKSTIEGKVNEPLAVKQPAQPVPSNINVNPNNIEPTITRIELFLEDKEWGKAISYAEVGLDYFPTDYRLYLYLLFAELKVSDYEELEKCSTSFSNNSNYKKAIRFADDETKERLINCSKNWEREKAYNKESEKNDFTLDGAVSSDNLAVENNSSNPNYKRFELEGYSFFEHEGYSFYFPKVLIPENQGIQKSITNNRKISIGDTGIKPVETDPVGVSDFSTIIGEEYIELDTGRLHLLGWEHKGDPVDYGYVKAFFRAPGDKEGLFFNTYYRISTMSSLINYYELLKKGYLHIEKIRGPIEDKETVISNIEELISKRKALLDTIKEDETTENEKLNLITTIEEQLLEMAGIQKTNDGFSFAHYHQLKHQFIEVYGFYGRNKWILAGRDDDRLLLLSKYSEWDNAHYSYKRECNWYASDLNKYMNVGEKEIQRRPMIHSFTRGQLSLFGTLTLLSSEELVRFLPEPKDRVLYDKDSSTPLPWILRDDVKANKVTVVNTGGICVKEKNYYSPFRGSYEAALRPAIWIDLNKIKYLV